MALNLLVIADLSQSSAAMVSNSVDAVARWSRHRATVVTNGVPPLAFGDLDDFDVILIHYSVFADQVRHLPEAARVVFRRSRATKVLWQQDEYRNVGALAKAMNDIDADIILTCLQTGQAKQVYGPYLDHEPAFLNVMTGYVSDRMLSQSSPPFMSRPVDIGYRGRRYPIWHGRLGAERMRIARETRKWASARGLSCDISVRERDRLYGLAWSDFLNRCRSTLVTESGASVFDMDGSLPQKVSRFVLRHPLASEREISEATYGPFEDLIDYAQISPRVFEAIAARSLLLLSPGRYSGLLAAGRHALIVEWNGGNADDIADAIRDPKRASMMIDAAHAEVLRRPELHERSFVEMLDSVIEAKAGSPRRYKADRVAFPSIATIADRRTFRSSSMVGRLVSRLVVSAVDHFPERVGRFFEALLRIAAFELRRSTRRCR